MKKKKEQLKYKLYQQLRHVGAPKWFHHFGPKKFRLFELVLGLAVRARYCLSYRRAARFLSEDYDLDLHWTTLQKAAARLPVSLWQAVLASLAPDECFSGAVDASGFNTTNPSHHYLRRINGSLPRCPVKLSVLVDTDSRKILSARIRAKPRHDILDVPSLIRQSPAKPWQLLMDKGYDSEKLHAFLDEKSIWSVAPTRKDCKRGRHRRVLRDHFPKGEYGYRNIVETVFMRLKKLFGGYVRSHKARPMRAEIYMRLIMYNMIVWHTRHFLHNRFLSLLSGILHSLVFKHNLFKYPTFPSVYYEKA